MLYFSSPKSILKKMKRILILLLLTSLAFCGYAQKRGTLHVNQDSRIERLMKRQRDVYAANNTMSGLFLRLDGIVCSFAGRIYFFFSRFFHFTDFNFLFDCFGQKGLPHPKTKRNG